VAADAGGIGFVGLAYVRSARALGVGDVGAEPRIASPFTVATEGYLLSRRLYLYTPDHPGKSATLDLVSFALSPDGQKVVRTQGFVDLSVGVQEPEPCPTCSLRYSTLVKNARRASVDFRFREGSHELDSRGARDLDRLVLYLRSQSQARVILLGFSDSQGDASDNTRISRERARSVAAELHARGVDAATVEGLGPERPVASNGTDAGRERNRRVEVWLATEAP
jgi:phosphate transport system substrate-binding protein